MRSWLQEKIIRVNRIQWKSDSIDLSAAEMFCWSIKKHNHRYTLYIGDGDANSFAKVREKLKEKFGDDYSVTENIALDTFINVWVQH